MLAYLLASRGIDTTLIERQRDFEREFRGEVLMPSGIDVFRRAGLAEQFAGLPQCSLRRARMYHQRRYVGALDLPDLLGPGAAFTAVSQPAMLEMLVAEASRSAHFTFIRGCAVRDLTIDGDRVRGVEASERGQARRIEADLIIGADGRASILRRKSGLDAVRRPQSFDIVWCKVPPLAGSYDGASLYLGHRHFALAFPTFDGRLQMAWVIRKGAIGELRSRGVEHWVNEMAAHIAGDLADHLRANLQDITQPFLLDVICDLMPQWSKPGLLLIGDAAHPMSPVGGQGINIALRDAVVAANHLVPALRGPERDFESIDQAAQRVQDERMDEVSRIQRDQQLPPALLFRSRLLTGALVSLLPALVGLGVAQPAARSIFRRFAFGISDVQLRV
jgi:2-polyprenyl-6-methoxyphenol hydroxylase-like FAD-dependent oxidoreductase